MLPRKRTRSMLCPIVLASVLLTLLFLAPGPGVMRPFAGGSNSAWSSTSVLDKVLQVPPISPNSLTAILPLTPDSALLLEDTLSSLFTRPNRLHEIIVLCPQSLVPQAQITIRRLSGPVSDIPLLLVHPLVDDLDEQSVILKGVSQVSTEWVLVLDSLALTQEDGATRDLLLNPPANHLPFGPRGFYVSTTGNVSCILQSNTPQPASYLYPPFVIPTSLILLNGTSWPALGKRISDSRTNGLGGIVIGGGTTATDWCSTNGTARLMENSFEFNTSWPMDASTQHAHDFEFNGTSHTPQDSGVFGIILPTLDDFYLLNPLACMLYNTGHIVSIFIYNEVSTSNGMRGYEARGFTSQHCTLHYTLYSGTTEHLPGPLGHLLAMDWLQTSNIRPDILLFPRDDDFTAGLGVLQKEEFLKSTVFIRLPRQDFPHSAWMGSLTINEWRHWKVPRLDISIITKDRPRSLARLLISLSQAKFFGDAVNLRIYMEQSADPKTMKIIDDFRWTCGSLFVHHRIVHGGLLTAVAESWYPQSNNSYGLLLEDDVELSPLFYAWAKMALLRYRHGDLENHSPRLFGVSLYQQKNLELPPEGRKPFNARALFTTENFLHPSIPYLSPVPCSWGAIYFPEHWKEFHAYLSARRSESSQKIGKAVVPNVRSNRWTKSWKKYFIELAYLRGYVMLYPNYPDFVSLSTNHLEVGSHVKVRTKEKQELFLLPLMELSTASTRSSTVSLLDLPRNRLPSWDTLPVLNLTGSITSLEALAAAGQSRRTELTGCTNTPAMYNAHDLLCIEG